MDKNDKNTNKKQKEETHIDERTTPWGVTVQSVEIRDIVIPQDLEDAMSRQAQAERERQARVILGESEKQIAASFSEASQAYMNNPTALHLRAMNMLFEGLKEKGALVIVPSSAIDTMNLGGMSGHGLDGPEQSAKGNSQVIQGHRCETVSASQPTRKKNDYPYYNYCRIAHDRRCHTGRRCPVEPPA